MIRHALMPRSAVLAAAAWALAALAGCAAEPSAARLVIVKAVYGSLPDGPSTDVTAKVAAMVKDNALTVDASNDLFGDPADGAMKRLRVDYTLDGVSASKTVAEDQTLTLPADEKPLVGKLAIVKAVYGDLAGGDVIDVTAKLAAMVKDNALTVVPSNDVFDDPATGVYKRLRVDYTIDGVPRRRTVGENRRLIISGNPR
ncbi:MAG: DUF3395 domain-containing protein [Phycisphaerae bacterium]